MSDNFRQEVEEIQQTCPANDDGVFSQDDCPYYPPTETLCKRCDVDRICAAAERMAERMPRPNQACQCNACWAARKKLAECQAHIRKECQ